MSIYQSYGPDQMEEHLSQFLINSWSYSKVSSFARNEKAFEMNYIFGVYSKKSATTIAGNAYHHALEYFFTSFKDGAILDLVELEQSAFAYINEHQANQWKIQKTTPTIEDCQTKAYKTVSALLRNFIGELSTYLEDIDQIIDIEIEGEEFIQVNGVDIPLPCRFKIDLVIKTKDGKVVIIDHKSKNAYSGDEEIALSTGEQAITYILCYEAKTGVTVDEVWFIENKYSQNKDNSQQLIPFKVKVDDNTRRLYEALLYEPLKKMIQAVNDPDYIYLINKSDNFVDLAEVYDFWCRTMIAEIGVEDFNVEESKKALISKRLKKIRDTSIEIVPPSVIKKFKENASQFIQYDLSNKNMTHSEKIEHSLRSFGVITRVAYEFEGYSSNTYLLEVSAGVAIKSIYARRLDIANALDVANVRISANLVEHEKKSYVAIDFSKKRDGDLLFDPSALIDMKIPLGKDNFGNIIYWDLNNHATPHALVCGSTGSGKSVCIKCIIEYAKLAGIDNIIIFDPKHEFKHYNSRGGILVINEIEDIEEYMAKMVDFMNNMVKDGKEKKTLVIFDEFADAVDQSRSGAELDIKQMVQVGQYAPKKGPFGLMMDGEPKMQLKKVGELKSLEQNLKILLQKGRSCGFRILAATQRASVKVITGDAKVNLAVKICFMVQKEVDSKVVLDEGGAESLQGFGDGLIKSPEYKETTRFQSYYKPEMETA